jgi:ribosomal protein RSM22 (predicted rRNA methylase)
MKTNKPTDAKLKTLAEHVARLSQLLTRDREHLPAAYLKDAGLREAYRTYFLPPNAKKIHIPLTELALSADVFPPKDLLRVLDLGSGPGTAVLGVLEYFTGLDQWPALRFTAVDRVQENLSAAEDSFVAEKKAYGLPASLTTIRSTIEDAVRLVPGPFDLIILSNVLNELFAREGRRIEKRLAVLEEYLTRLLADNGTCIIIEPALRETSRDLLLVRDGLLQQGLTIYAPCLCHAPCPALENPKDWCHEDSPWDPPAVIEALDGLTGLRKDSLKFSYLTIRKDGRSLSALYDDNTHRVVSEPLITKGKSEFFFCGAQGRRLVTRLDKDTMPGNEAFGSLQRGDIVRLTGAMDEKNRFKISKETGVTACLSRK